MGNEIKKMEAAVKVNAKVVLMKKTTLGFPDSVGAVLDRAHELLGRKVSLQLVSSVDGGDPGMQLAGKLGKPAYLEDWITTITLSAGDTEFKVTFDWDEEFGVPGALIVKNFHHNEFYLRAVTLTDIPRHGRVHFVCDSWVYPTKRYKKDRVFFTNQTYLPSQTPLPLRRYREEELQNLRGDGMGERHEWDRIYDYDYYNDLGDPDKGENYVRPILGGTAEYPYPRRVKTGRDRTKKDPNAESKLPIRKGLGFYVPRDEQLSDLKMSDAVAYFLKAIGQLLVSELEGMGSSPNEFESFQDVLDLYEGKFELPQAPLLRKIQGIVPLELISELVRTDGEKFLKFPIPQVIKEDKSAWRTDEEFAREMLAGLNPLIIHRLQEFPPTSKLDPELYGDQTSSITKEHIEKNLDRMTVEEAIEKGKMFCQDYHDVFMPYLRRINTETSTKAYATRILLFLREDGTLKPLAIELSLPHPEGDQFGVISKVFTPAEQSVDGSIWQLAKAYAAVNDSGYHQLISHWLHTHAVIEPFIIATKRQLSVLHPIYKLLHPHFKDTMNINGLSRQIINNADGLLEKTVFPAKFSMELTAKAYKKWVFPEQALPADLLKRGLAIEDPKYPHGLRLLIEDYPYAVDGLEIWSAVKTWVQDYCSFYYRDDEMVREDCELQSWWQEVRNKGHGDKKDEPWWPKMHRLSELVEACTIIIWIASALHAAVNFGQYPYGGFLLNRPSISRKFMPEPGTPEYKEVEVNPEKAFLRTVTSQLQTLIGITLVEILSRHAADEVFLGERGTPEWTSDSEPLEAFTKFGKKLKEIERTISEMNNDKGLKNRYGPAKMPYTLLFPSSEVGLTGMGIPNSVSM